MRKMVGEGGLLDNVVEEGGVVDGFDFKYGQGEILIPTASRADVVAAIPDTATGTLTLWTRDFERTGPGYSRIPNVPVLHLNVPGAPGAPEIGRPSGREKGCRNVEISGE